MKDSTAKTAYDTKSNVKKIKNFENINESSEVTSKMNQILADEFAVFTKTLNYHWNVTGPRFMTIHQFLGKQYHELLGIMDELAERIRIVGDRPMGTLAEFSRQITVPEKPGTIPNTSQMMADLLQDHLTIREELIELITKNPESSMDPGTEDLLINVLKTHEEMAWILSSHLEH